MNDDLLQEVTEIAAQVARQIHNRYAVYFDVADLRQELMIWAMTHKSKVNEWLSTDQEVKDRKAGIRQLAKSMQREADRYCRTAKAKASGYELRDEYYYTTGLIEELIANFDAVLEPSHNSQARVSGGGSDPATGNNFLVSIIDVKAALEKLEPVDRLMLEMRFQEQQTLDQIADTLGVSGTTVFRRINKALKRMVDDLGGDNPFAGTRRVVSNSQARAMLE